MANSVIYNRIYGIHSKSKSKSLVGGALKFNIDHILKLFFAKKEFLILVFANLIVQLGITYYVMKKTNTNPYGQWPLFIAQFIIIYVIIMVPMPPALKFVIFSILSYTLGISLSNLKKKYNEQLIDVAIQGALSVFGIMMAAAITLIAFGIQLSNKFGNFLFWALIALIIARIVILCKGLTTAHKVISYIGILLFALFVLYDTQQILRRDYSEDFITASMDYYLDILNLFTSFLGTEN
jgi:FtsH-binding integral membrane protein